MRSGSLKSLILPVALVITLGTYGYHIIEGWSIADSLYMTVTTLTTVGYGEVHPLSEIGRLFTIVLIILGVGTATYSFSKIVGLIVEGEIFKSRQRRLMDNKILNLNQHIIICGYGRLGHVVHKDLLESKQEIVVIEQDDHKISELESNGFYFVKGSAYEDDVLKKAGVQKAKVLLTLLPSDADNVYVTLCARDLNPNIRIVARTEDDGGESRLRRAGANEVIAPYRLSGNKIVQKIIRPYVSDFLEVAGTGSKHNLVIEEVVVPENSKVAGKTLEDSTIRAKTGAIIAAIISNDGKMTFNPTGKDVIEAGDTMIVLGEQDALNKISGVL